MVLSAPEVFAHNLETVPRIFRRIRPAFSYERSLAVLEHASRAGLLTKSNLILGMGETRAEVEEAIDDLVAHRVDILTITQYMRPSKLQVGLAILAEASLSYLGLGTPAPTPSWGRMLADAQQYLPTHPMYALWPGLIIGISAYGANLFGDGLRDRLDPRHG